MVVKAWYSWSLQWSIRSKTRNVVLWCLWLHELSLFVAIFVYFLMIFEACWIAYCVTPICSCIFRNVSMGRSSVQETPFRCQTIDEISSSSEKSIAISLAHSGDLHSHDEFSPILPAEMEPIQCHVTDEHDNMNHCPFSPELTHRKMRLQSAPGFYHSICVALRNVTWCWMRLTSETYFLLMFEF